MYTIYPAVFFKEENGYSVIFPDLNYLATGGNSLADAVSMASDCLTGYLYYAEIDNEPVAAPSDINEINPERIAKELDFSYEQALIKLIYADIEGFAKLQL